MLPGMIPIVSPTWTPLKLTELFCWLDPQQRITLNGADVSNWEAVNDATLDFVQATASQQPTYTSQTINSVQALDFVRSTSQVLTESTFSPTIGTGDFYLALVAEWDIVTPNIYGLFRWGASQAGIAESEGPLQFNSNGNKKTFTSLGTPSTATPYVVEMWRSGTSIRCRLNGTADSDSRTGAESLNNSSADVGWGGAGQYFDGRIGDIVFCNSLPSSADRDLTKDFLAAKYGITVS